MKKLKFIPIALLCILLIGCSEKKQDETTIQSSIQNVTDINESSETTDSTSISETTAQTEDTSFPIEMIKMEDIETIDNPITDEQINEQLDYIETVLKDAKTKDDINNAFKDYWNLYLEEEKFDVYRSGEFSGIDTYMFTADDNFFGYEVGDYYYTFYDDNSVRRTFISEVTDNEITEDDSSQHNYSSFITFPYDRILNILKTRRAGIVIRVMYDFDFNVMSVAIEYVSGENNQIDRILYKSGEEVERFYDTSFDDYGKYPGFLFN